MAMATKKSLNEFDIATLEKMTEPIAIRITRIDRSTNNQIPLPMPQAEWSKDDAKRIESIVLQDIGGGGLYNGEMSGANGVSFKWRFMFPEQQFPPKFPATMAGAMGAPPNGNGAPHPATAPPGTVWTTAPYVGPGGAAVPMAAPYQAPSYQPQARTPIMPNYYPAPWGATPSAAAPSSSFKEDQLRAELEQMRRTAMDSEHRRERDAADARHAAEMAELRRAIQENQKPAGPDPQLEALKLQMEQQRQQYEREREERARRDEERRRQEEDRRREAEQLRRQEAEQRREEHEREERRWREEQDRRRTEEERRREDERREREHQRQLEDARRREEMAAREAEAKKFELLMQMQQTQMQNMQAALANNPIVSMLGESLRQSATAQQDAARSAAEAPMKSMEMARMFRDMSGGDQLLKNVAEAYSGAHGIGMRSLEMMNQMIASQQGSPGWEILAETLGGAKETINNFVTGKARAEREKAKVEQMQSQERMMAQQAAAAQAYAEQMAQQAATDPSLQAEAQQAAVEAQQAKEQHAETINDLQSAATEAQSAVEKQEAREEQMFGMAYEQVLQVRQHVAENTDPETREVPDEVIDQVAFGIVTGAHQIEATGADVPAFALLREGRIADLVEYMVPEASSEFIGKCAGRVEEFSKRVANRHKDTPAMDILQQIQAELFGDGDDEDEDDDE